MMRLSFLPAICGFLAAGTLTAQQNPPKYSIGINLIGPGPSCPADLVFIGQVVRAAPAAAKGIHIGDQLLA
jgi:hypothetical protein